MKWRTYNQEYCTIKILIQIWWSNQKLYRQAKVKRLQDYQISFTTNAKATTLGRTHKRREISTKSKPKTIKKMIIGSYILIVIAVQLLSYVPLFGTPWTSAYKVSLFITNSKSLLKLISIELVMPSNHLILCCPLFPLPSIFPSIRVFSNGSALPVRWPKCWSFSFSISPSNEHSGLISFRIEWFDLFAIQMILKSLLQNHSSKVSILQSSAFFMV